MTNVRNYGHFRKASVKAGNTQSYSFVYKLAPKVVNTYDAIYYTQALEGQSNQYCALQTGHRSGLHGI